MKLDEICQKNTECFQWARWRLTKVYTFSKTVSQFAETQACAGTLTRAKRVQQVLQKYIRCGAFASVCSLFIHVEKDKSGDNYWLC